MTTPSPTGNQDGQANGSREPQHFSVGLPDEETLARLAFDLYGTLNETLSGTAPGAYLNGNGQERAPDRGTSNGVPAGRKAAARSWRAPGRAAELDAGQLAALPHTLAGPAAATATGPEPTATTPLSAGPSAPAAPSFYFIHERHRPGPAPDAISYDTTFDVHAVRRDFPILQERVHGQPLVWLDNAATTHKPQCVIDRLAHYYAHQNSNVHRGAHALAARATDAYEQARATVADYLGAPSASSVVFTRGTTEAINLVAQAWGGQHVGPGDEIVVSHLEHHANIVPWQRLAEQAGARLRIIPVEDDGSVAIASLDSLLNHRTRLVAVAHVSNVLGTIVPVREIIDAAHRAGARVLIDGAQAVAHLPVDLRSLDADFYAFSGHKVFGPTGIGALYAKPDLLAEMPPWQGGGNMIKDVTFERTLYQDSPAKFEAGTGNIADAAGLGAALEYMRALDLPAIGRYEHELLTYATERLATVPGLTMVGTAPEKTSVLTFTLHGCGPDQIGTALDRRGIAVRAGHHCAQPILRRYGLEAAVRSSLAMYNTRADVDALVGALKNLVGRHDHQAVPDQRLHGRGGRI